MDERLVTLSKALARLLRHRPDSADVVLDQGGWCEISTLLDGLARNGVQISRDDFEKIVARNDKARYAVSEDGRRVRAVQGHSVVVNLGLRVQHPPTVLYHGTTARALAAVLRQGLQPMRRHQVHLSTDVETAQAVAKRKKGEYVLLRVDAGAMQRAGHRFYLSENSVWLVDAVPPRYLTVVK